MVEWKIILTFAAIFEKLRYNITQVSEVILNHRV